MPKDDLPFINAHDCLDIASRWVADFDREIRSGNVEGLAILLGDDTHWRDLLAFTWHTGSISGRDNISARLIELAQDKKPEGFTVDPNRTAPRWVTRAGQDCIEAIFSFRTSIGNGAGAVRLVADPDGVWRAWTISTTLQEIEGHAERFGEARTGGDAFNREFGGDNWLDYRNKQRAYEDRDPAVLVVGGGQAGLGIAARLTHLGVDTLTVDSHSRIGDNWRKRYHSLTLHNEVHVNHLPYMPFPPTWPVYIPKDMLANWFEIYVEALELNYWAGTSLTSGSYDDAAGCWNVTLTFDDGSTRQIKPRHIVMSTGVSAIPIMPELPGMSEFKGTVMHSGAYSEGHEWSGKKALVVGTGNSAHDVAQDLHACGADVTMIQRSSTHVVSLAEAQRVYTIYAEGPPVDDCDLLATSFPFPVLKQGYQRTAKHTTEVDKPLLDGLRARGFKLNSGVEDCGFQMSYLQRGGGYYFNVGCSDLLVNGEINLIQYDDIATFGPDGALMKDGSTKPADLIVMATGYKNQQDTARVFLGDDVADRIGPVWGFGDDGELRNMWRRTNQPGLWFTAGSLAQCRIFSKFLALQIKACEEGLISPTLPSE